LKTRFSAGIGIKEPFWSYIAESKEKEIRVVFIDSFVQRDLKIKRIVLFIRTDNIFFDGAHN